MTTETSTDVIVVGGGVAGLQAAAELARAGLRVDLIEARDRLGGRILSVPIAEWPGPAELGAEFVHGGNKLIRSILRRARIALEEVPEKHWWIAADGQRCELPETWDRIDAVMRAIGPNYRGSFAQWLKRHGRKLDPADRELAERFVEGFQGAPLGRMSAPSLFAATEEDEEQSRVKGGYGRLVTWLEQQLPRWACGFHRARWWKVLSGDARAQSSRQARCPGARGRS